LLSEYTEFAAITANLAIKARPAGRGLRTSTSPELVARARAGDPDAVSHLLESQRRRIVGLARFFTRNAADAEDLAQDILIRLMQGLPGLDRPETFDVWVYRTSRNRCIDHFRRRKLEAPFPSALDERSDPLWVSSPRGPDDSLEARETIERLRDALEMLPPAWRRAVVLRDLEELSYEEVADHLALPLGTVKSQINRGRARLAKALVH
jgi:RNA polymerase sigma-70 factor (ECF subfamily)